MLYGASNLSELGTKVLFRASFARCPRVWRMASTLSKSGFDVTVLEWDRDSKLPATEYTKKIRVYRMKSKAPYGSRLIFKLPLWWTYISLFLLLNRFAVVQPQNLDNLFPSLIICHVRQIRIVYDVADFYADAYARLLLNVALLRKAIAWLERTLIKAVDATIVVDESRLKQINLRNLPFWVIYNSPPDVLNKMRTNARVHEAYDSKVTLFYAGILERDRGLHFLIEAVRALAGVELLIAGFGRMEKELTSSAKEVCSVKFLGRIPHKAVLEFTFLCDCVVALYDPSVPNNVYASPNKLFEAMMCGKPIIVSRGTAMAEKVLTEKCGLVVNYGNIKELGKAINTFRTDENITTLLGTNAREAYLKKYNWNLMRQRLMRLYAAVLGNESIVQDYCQMDYLTQ
jgi:glycosyltransferase involved in cell wall biosynthesis